MFPTMPVKPTPPTMKPFAEIAAVCVREWLPNPPGRWPLDVALDCAENIVTEEVPFRERLYAEALAKHAAAMAVYERRLAHWQRVQAQVVRGDTVRAERRRYIPSAPPRDIGAWRVWVEHRQPTPTDRGVRPDVVVLRHFERTLPDGRILCADANLTRWGDVTWTISINVSRTDPDGYVWRTFLEDEIDCRNGVTVQWPMALQWVKRAAGVR